MNVVDPATVCPTGLLDAMVRAGFTVYSRQRAYARMQWPTGFAAAGNPAIVVPLDTTAPEFAQMMTSVLATLRGVALAGAAATDVLHGVSSGTAYKPS